MPARGPHAVLESRFICDVIARVTQPRTSLSARSHLPRCSSPLLIELFPLLLLFFHHLPAALSAWSSLDGATDWGPQSRRLPRRLPIRPRLRWRIRLAAEPSLHLYLHLCQRLDWGGLGPRAQTVAPTGPGRASCRPGNREAAARQPKASAVVLIWRLRFVPLNPSLLPARSHSIPKQTQINC